MKVGGAGLAASPEHEFSIAVVGIGYPNPEDGSNRRFEILTLERGTAVELRREPKHPRDRYAVGVFSPSGIRIGYLPAERSPWIGGKIGDGLEAQAVFQELQAAVAIIRVRLGGGAPTLPVERPRRPTAAPDLYPDEDGPEWGA